MTQLDLPQVSLQRYFDLLKRRRWQVVPVSLLGLLVGGLVALLIPRYFVAETQLTYRSSPGDVVKSRDPVGLMVENAKLTIPDAVTATLARIGWPEASSLTGLPRDEYVRALRQRIEVVDISPGRDREFAKLQLSYKDRDGLRAKTFLDMLVSTWVAKELKVMRDKANSRLQAATTESQRASQAFESYSKDLKDLEQRAGLWPDSTAGAEQDASRTAQQRRAQLLQDVGRLEVEQKGLQLELERLVEAIDNTPRKVEGPDALGPEVIPDDPLVQKLAATVKALRMTVKELGPAHPARKARELDKEEAEALLRVALERLGIGAGQNPQRQLLVTQQKQKSRLFEENGLQLAQAQQELQQLDARQQQLTEAWAEHRRLDANLASATTLRDATQAEVAAARSVLGQLSNDDPIEYVGAWVPPGPTDPNILLVALIGCVIGLGVAIGLILAIDLLQGTYKTVDDVERGLAVPVLGGMSHLETVEQRTRVAGSRKRASLFAGTFLVLMVVVVTWYYREPTSLPPFVRDLLSVVLGQG